MAAALSGNLRDFGIADVFQLIGQQRKTGVLEFTGEEGTSVRLCFDSGNVVSAAPAHQATGMALGHMLVRCGRLTQSQLDRLVPESEATAQPVPNLAVSKGWIESDEVDRIEDLLTRETLFDVLRWQSGEFDFRAQPVEHGRRPDSLLGAEQILMDSLRMIDEWHSFSELVPSEDVVFQRVSGVEEYRRRTALDGEQLESAERVFALVNGRIHVRRIVDLSLLGSFDAVRLLADLRRCEVIEPLDPEALERLRAVKRPSTGAVRAEAASWLAGLVPVLLLAGMLGWVWTREVAPPAQAGFALPGQVQASLVDAYATRRSRHAVEAHRFFHGEWPAGLGQVADGGLLSDGALAAADAASYYYVRRDDGVILLAPVR